MKEILIFLSGFISAFIGTTAGGGGAFVSLFAFTALGFPLPLAIGTNKFGGVGMYPLSIRNFSKADVVDKKLALKLGVLFLVASVIGALLVVSIDTEIVNIVVSFFLLLAFLIFVCNKNIGIKEKNSHWSWPIFYFLVKVYSGFVGAGGGIFSMWVLTALRGKTAVKAMATNNVIGLLKVVPLCVFIFSGYIDYYLGVFLFLGNLLGGHVGSKASLNKGNVFVKRFLIVIILATITKILFW